jgi:hypothetical protein
MPDDHQIEPPATPDSLESRPPAEADVRRKIRISSPESLVRLVPILLGFRPEASIVILGAEPPRGTVKMTVRFSLDGMDAPEVATYNIDHVLNMLTRQDSSMAVVIGYGPDERVTPFIKLFQEQASQHNLKLTELVRVEDNRYWSYVCTDPTCCSPEGTSFDPAPDPALTGLRPEGASGVLASREALSALVAAVVGPDAESMLASVSKAEGRADRLIEQARAWGSQTTRRYPIALAGIRAVRDAILRYRHGESAVISHDEAGWLLLALRDLWVRDDAWSRMEADHRQAHRRLWLDLTRLARPGTVAAPASLLAFVTWQSGNGALAHVALDRALADDPDYSMAHILRRTLDCGMDPSKAEVPMTPEQVAESYAGAAEEITAISRPWWL